MSNPVGYQTELGADFITLYDTENKPANETEVTTYISDTTGYVDKDLGSIFTLYSGLAASNSFAVAND